MKIIALVFAVGCLMAGSAQAGESHGEPYVGSTEFQRVKKLAGKWEGTANMGTDTPQKVSAEYAVTSGGNAVIERIFTGTPHEMISIYYDRGGKLTMTHYCMLPNRPEMELKKADGQQLELELGKKSGIKNNETHMHALRLSMADGDHLKQDWTLYESGKEKAVTSVLLERMK